MKACVAQFGEIIECRVLKDKDSSCNRGVAFVQYNIRSEATDGESGMLGKRPNRCDWVGRTCVYA